MSWIAKLLNLLFGENEEEDYRKENQHKKMIQNRKNMAAAKEDADIKARVVYQYPTGNFRFPLISDDEEFRHKQNFNQKTSNFHVSNTEILQKGKNAFHPTDIPSPVFGFGPRMKDPILKEAVQKRRAEEEISSVREKDRPHEENAPVFMAKHVSRKETEFQEKDENTHTLEAENPPMPIQLANDGFDQPNYEESTKNDDRSNEHSSIDDKVNVQKAEERTNDRIIDDCGQLNKEADERSDQTSKTLKEENIRKGLNVENTQTSRHHQGEMIEKNKKEQTISGEIQQNRKTVIPYNVIMFGKDKQKIRLSEKKNGYLFPPITLLNIPPLEKGADKEWIEKQQKLLDITLKNFHVQAKVVNVSQGPSVTRFEVHPEPGVKVSKITNLTDDIKLSLSAKDIRIEAPIPGKNTVGIEVPNRKSKTVFLREVLRSKAFSGSMSPLAVALGLDISGEPVVTDVKKMPHGLIAGATGSGKSVCINTILVSLLYKASPNDVKLLLIDPKMVELAPYNQIPHLVSPVITDVKAATAALKWAVEEMERRYELFAHSGVRDIEKYNDTLKEHQQKEKLPYIVIVIDELADLMMVSPGDVEESICRIAQKARACGIHLLIATQRPSVDVITGLIKANIPTRIAFSVSSQVDSRTILDTTGAERLLGKGDMLFLENGSSKPVRIQGTFVSDEEIDRVVQHVKRQQAPHYLFQQEELIKKANWQEEDDLFYDACEFVIEQGQASTSSLQRRFRIGYNRAARLIDLMEEHGIISAPKGSKPRDVLVSEEELKVIKENSGDKTNML